MRYVEAFNKLGYQVPAPRTDWTAEKENGVCLTLWKTEVIWTPPPPRIDLFEAHIPNTSAWEKLPGHSKRTKHLARAWRDLDGKVDVVLISGIPGEGVKDADPWLAEQRDGFGWRLTKFDNDTGFFAAVVEKQG